MKGSMVRLGIQGDRGSANEDACKIFIKRQGWQNPEIVYLINTFNVLKALQKEEIDFGTFAFRTARGGLVEETQEAIKLFPFTKVDEIEMELHHSLFCNGPIDTGKKLFIVSHTHALADHRSFLEETFPDYELFIEEDTAVAAQKLKSGVYPPNTLVIAPYSCADIYQLDVFMEDLPTNRGYITTFYLVKKAD